jgi:hypothetical protein
MHGMSEVAIGCGRKVGFALVLLVLAVAVVGSEAIGTAAGIAAGVIGTAFEAMNHFWVWACLALGSLGVLAWVLCVCRSALSEALDQNARLLFFLGFLSSLSSVVSTTLLHDSAEALGRLTTHELLLVLSVTALLFAAWLYLVYVVTVETIVLVLGR